MIWTPIGSPSGLLPIGIVVAGSPTSIAIPADRVAMRSGHPLRAADRVALDQAVDDLDAAGERCAVHGVAPKVCMQYDLQIGCCQ